MTWGYGSIIDAFVDRIVASRPLRVVCGVLLMWSVAERSVPTSLRPSGAVGDVGLSDGGGYLARGKPNDSYTSGGGTGSNWPLYVADDSPHPQ